jgi:nicotinate-nucleotide adenylyltransferase
MKIGIFSGTFDPVHVGHIEFALMAREQCGLLGVIFLLERAPREKSPTAYKHRLRMLERAVGEHQWLSVREMPEQQFNVGNTLPKLLHDFSDAELVFLMGSDIVHTFSYRWPGLDELLKQVQLVVAARAHETVQSIQELLNDTYKSYNLQPHFTVLPSPHKHLASTKIRTGEHFVTDISSEVAQYIKAHKLYT